MTAQLGVTQFLAANLLYNPYELTVARNASGFVQAVPTSNGWHLKFYLVKGNLQLVADFRDVVPSHLLLDENAVIELCSTEADIVALLVIDGKYYEAQFTGLEGLIELNVETPQIVKARDREDGIGSFT